MIIRSLLTALLALLAYHLSYPSLPVRFNRITGQQRCNLDRAERFVLGTNASIGIILGSSMSLRLDDRVLGPAWQKLTLPGCSILTGLEILRRSGKSPQVLLIECNQCAWDANEDILNDAFNPLLKLPRRHSRMFLEEARPLNFVIGFSEACLARILGKISGPAELTAESHDQVLDAIRRQMDADLPLGQLQRRVADVGEAVDYFRRMGCLCILYEMPIDPALKDLKSPRQVRRAMHERFPGSRYDWITFDHPDRYETSDGLHLNRDDARLLTAELLHQVDVILAGSVAPFMDSRSDGGRDGQLPADPRTLSRSRGLN